MNGTKSKQKLSDFVDVFKEKSKPKRVKTVADMKKEIKKYDQQENL